MLKTLDWKKFPLKSLQSVHEYVLAVFMSSVAYLVLCRTWGKKLKWHPASTKPKQSQVDPGAHIPPGIEDMNYFGAKNFALVRPKWYLSVDCIQWALKNIFFQFGKKIG